MKSSLYSLIPFLSFLLNHIQLPSHETPSVLSQPESVLYDVRFPATQFVLEPSPLRPTTIISFFQLNTCGYSPYITFSLMRGWVCHLQLLLALTSTVILMSESYRTHDHILLLRIWDSPNQEGQIPVFISLRNWVTQLHPQAPGFPFHRHLLLAGLQWKYFNAPPRRGIYLSWPWVLVIQPQISRNRKHRFLTIPLLL
jgi:hypothetical protein